MRYLFKTGCYVIGFKVFSEALRYSSGHEDRDGIANLFILGDAGG
jgi:hypothetical protein